MRPAPLAQCPQLQNGGADGPASWRPPPPTAGPLFLLQAPSRTMWLWHFPQAPAGPELSLPYMLLHSVSLVSGFVLGFRPSFHVGHVQSESEPTKCLRTSLTLLETFLQIFWDHTARDPCLRPTHSSQDAFPFRSLALLGGLSLVRIV